MNHTRALLSAVVLAASLMGCDTTDDLVPIQDDMLVALADSRLLQVSTESYNFCGVPIFVDSRSGPGSLEVFVRGAERVSISCDALVRGTWSVALPSGLPAEVRIHHRGATDHYEIRSTESGLDLVAVRTSTTRLADPPGRDGL